MFVILKSIFLGAALGQFFISVSAALYRRRFFVTDFSRLLLVFIFPAYFYLSGELASWAILKPNDFISAYAAIASAWIVPGYFLFCWNRKIALAEELGDSKQLSLSPMTYTVLNVPSVWATIVFLFNCMQFLLLPLEIVSFLFLFVTAHRLVGMVVKIELLSYALAVLIAFAFLTVFFVMITWLISRASSRALVKLYGSQSDVIRAKSGWLGDPNRLAAVFPKFMRRLLPDM